jgi:hypothetical protein
MSHALTSLSVPNAGASASEADRKVLAQSVPSQARKFRDGSSPSLYPKSRPKSIT